MPLEATVICLDNSEYNRNGDFAPSRWDSQQDAATNICDVKLNQNPENTIGLMSMAGSKVDVKLTQTQNIDAVLASIAQIEINGMANFFTAVKVAQLSLKHRMNKQQRQRIVVFVGHPIEEELSECETLGKRLKRNNVAIDVINFANADNVPKLEALVQCANNSDNCHFLDVPIGSSMIIDVLATSPILLGDDAADGMAADMGAGAGADAGGVPGGQFAETGGINPELDPELAEAMRISMQEANATARVQESAAADGDQTARGDEHDVQPTGVEDDEEEHDEQYYLDLALKISMEPAQGDPQAETTDKGEGQKQVAAGQGGEEKAAEPEEKVNLEDVVTTDFMKDIIKDMNLDIDPNEMGDLMAQVGKKEGEEKKEDDKDKKKDGDDKKPDKDAK